MKRTIIIKKSNNGKEFRIELRGGGKMSIVGITNSIFQVETLVRCTYEKLTKLGFTTAIENRTNVFMNV